MSAHGNGFGSHLREPAPTPAPSRSGAMRSVPRLRTDEEVEVFLDQDLSDLDFGQFSAGQLEYERKDARLTMRLPQPMLDAVK